MELDKVAGLLNSYDGRDKLTKTLQFTSRIIKWYYLEKLQNKEVAQNYGALSLSLSQSRKLFSLFKSLSELQKIIKLIQANKLYETDYFLTLGTRIFYAIKWMHDNLAVLIAIKFLKGDQNKAAINSSFYEALSNVCTITQLVKNLYSNYENTAKWLKFQGGDQKKQLQILQQAQRNILINLAKTIGDFLVALQGSGLYTKMTGTNMNELVFSVAGFVAGSIATYQNY